MLMTLVCVLEQYTTHIGPVHVLSEFVVTDDAHAGSVWCVGWRRGCQGGSLSVRSALSLSLSLVIFLLRSSFQKTIALKTKTVILICNLTSVKDLPLVDCNTQ